MIIDFSVLKFFHNQSEEDMALYTMTFHWTYCRYKTVFLTIFEISGQFLE